MGEQLELPHTDPDSLEAEDDLKIPIIDEPVRFYVPNEAPCEEIAKVVGWLKLLPGSYVECDLEFEGRPYGKHRLTLTKL